MPNLNINPEIVCQLIDRAREFQAQEGVTLPSEPIDAESDWSMGMISAHEEDLTYQDAAAAIDDLEPDQQIELVALMWIGRGDFDASEWETALAEAEERHTSRTAAYLMSTPMVADYLREGLAELGYGCED